VHSAGGAWRGGSIGGKLIVEQALFSIADAALSDRDSSAFRISFQPRDLLSQSVALGLRRGCASGFSFSVCTCLEISVGPLLCKRLHPVGALNLSTVAVAAPASQSGHQNNGQ